MKKILHIITCWTMFIKQKMHLQFLLSVYRYPEEKVKIKMKCNLLNLLIYTMIQLIFTTAAKQPLKHLDEHWENFKVIITFTEYLCSLGAHIMKYSFFKNITL